MNFLNPNTNYQVEESFGTSKAVNVSSWDIQEQENDEGSINKFYQTENINPKFMKFSKKSEKKDFNETENEKVDCNTQETPKN